MAGTDEKLSPGSAHQLLADLQVFRCTSCGVPIIDNPCTDQPRWRPHRGCGGLFRLVQEPFARAVLMRLMARHLLGRG